ncbi:protein of unknown function (plasmid) [Caballeronia sp. S22]
MTQRDAAIRVLETAPPESIVSIDAEIDRKVCAALIGTAARDPCASCSIHHPRDTRSTRRSEDTGPHFIRLPPTRRRLRS